MFLFRNSVTGDVLHPLDPSIRLQLEDIDDRTSFFIYRLVNSDEGNFRSARLEFLLQQSIVSGEDYDMWLADQEKVTAWTSKHKKWDPFDEDGPYTRKVAQAIANHTGRQTLDAATGKLASPEVVHIPAPSKDEIIKAMEERAAQPPNYKVNTREEYAMKRKLEEPPFELVEEVKDHINPSHYQGFFDWEGMVCLQWLETMSGIMEPSRFEGGLELMTRKYIDRRGGKDEEIQELKKSLWYLKYWIAYLANGKSVTRVQDVEELIK
jgi:hypothetical protein